ncbi:hypothetical protein DRE_00352 [Drechslerella stenobrocha 248]|uniref:ATP-dependent DNA ligase family profile domain-containing protein n=1 Tax=Drechslerella stenobrocha 248 TaxID=1043628 RepID=W7HV33_9PEZI|nr:hypothetical protein DRE_00352 [Drechslerella stenobrocha 248]
MPFLFTHVCDLLSTLEALHLSVPGKCLGAGDLHRLYKPHLASWIAYFRADLTPDLWLAWFSVLWPEGRPDRVYGFKEDGLVNAVAGAMCLGPSRVEELRRWRTGGRGDRDLAECVERVFAMAENVVMPSNGVTIAEVESVLNTLASHCRFSSSEIRASRSSNGGTLGKDKPTVPVRESLLGSIYRRLSSRDAKWFTRVLLKSLLPVAIDPEHLFREFHFLLPQVWRVRSQLASALSLLGSKTFKLFPCLPCADDEGELTDAAVRLLMPEMGVKVGRPVFMKALSCDWVLGMVGKGVWAVERKYDGEYCQIHVDLGKGKDWLKIYSKSGRDSTQDRVGCHAVIREALQLDSPEKRVVRQRCILEAEFLVYSNRQQQIASFHSIRNHVTRSGTYIGTSLSAVDQHRDSEHIMLKFFDCILLDDICTPASSYNARRHHLENLIKRIPNRAELVTRKLIDFGRPAAREAFLETFAQGIGMKWEGFVMKPCEGNYVEWGVAKGNFWIKLKKDYIPGFGDSADFAIVGGRFGGKRGVERGLDPDTANTFYAACLTNKHDVVNLSAKPTFKVVFTVSYNLTQVDLAFLKTQRYFHGIEGSDDTGAAPYNLSPLDSHFPKPDFLFSQPPVLECFGAGFDKIDTSDYWTLRWPRVQKIHRDRGYLDAVTFQDLQAIAEKASGTSGNCADEVGEWEQKLKASVRKSRNKSQDVPGGMLERSFWQADSPTTTKTLDVAMRWAPPHITSARESQSVGGTPTPPKGVKRPLSKSPGDEMRLAGKAERRQELHDSPGQVISTSPLFMGPVYLMECLSDKPAVQGLFAALKIDRCGSCRDLAIDRGVETADASNGKRKAILLIEERKREEIRDLMGRLKKASAEGNLVVDVYSWRILKMMKRMVDRAADGRAAVKRRRVSEDWSVMHLDTIC